MPPLDQITDNLPCGSCGYNLRSLALAARCPECGRDVADTIDAWAEVERISKPLRDACAMLAGLPLFALTATVIAIALVWLWKFYAVLGTLLITLLVFGVLYYFAALSFVQSAGQVVRIPPRVAPAGILTISWLTVLITSFWSRLGSIVVVLIAAGTAALLAWTAGYTVLLVARLNQHRFGAHAHWFRRISISSLVVTLSLMAILLALHLTGQPLVYVNLRRYVVTPLVCLTFLSTVGIGTTLMYRLYRLLQNPPPIARYLPESETDISEI